MGSNYLKVYLTKGDKGLKETGYGTFGGKKMEAD